jgi:hypothetical protein
VVATIHIYFRLPSHFLDVRPQRHGFILLAAFLLSFLFIRTSARLMRSPKVPWWPGSVTTEGGLHLHHLVWGIVLILLSGFLRFSVDPDSPWGEILAALFGIGAGFTLDEFALWVHLEDVYWSNEGRSSIDAVIVATVIAALVVLGIAPFDTSSATPVESLVVVVGIDGLLCIAVILKGRPLIALIGAFVIPVSFVVALRLASPTSPWSRRRYKPGSAKLARSQARFGRMNARNRRLLDLIGGRPSAAAAPAIGGPAIGAPDDGGEQ